MPNASTTFYPSLTELIKVDQIPSNLGFLHEGLTDLLKDIYIKDYYSNISQLGDNASYRLKLVSYKPIGIEIPGTNGLALLFNPDLETGSYSAIPISFNYNLEILKYVRGLKLSNFKGDPINFFDFLLSAFGVSASELLQEALDVFFEDEIDPLQTFVDRYNAKYTPITSFTDIEDVLSQVLTDGYDGFEIIFNLIIDIADDLEGKINNLRSLFHRWLGDFTTKDILNLFIPQISLSIEDITVGLQIPLSVMRRVDAIGNPLLDDKGNNLPSILSCDIGTLYFSTKEGLQFFNEGNISFTKSEILKTGITLEFNEAKLDFSRTSNIPEATADGRPDDFVGVFVKDATIGLPAFWKNNDKDNQTDPEKRSTAVIKGKNLLIGTGGISGTIGMEAMIDGDSAPLLKTRFGGSDDDDENDQKGLEIQLTSFDLTFQQNAIISSNIKGKLIIPGWKKKGTNEPAEVEITISIQNGDFVITADMSVPLEIEIPNVMVFLVKSISVGKIDDRFFINLAGEIDVTLTIPGVSDLLSDKIEIQKLTVWSNGQIEFAGGGAFNLKKPLTLNIKPLKLSITAIHLGLYEQYKGGYNRKYKYIGFDGGLSINPGGIDAKGSGIKIYFSTDEHPLDVFLRIQSISIDLMLSGKDPALQLRGMLASSGDGDEYIGGISFKLKKPSLSGSAAMRINPKIPAFLIDIGIELPTPIMLGATGLGIYQFRALLGQRYVATKKAAGLTEEQGWYDYYKKKLPPSNRVGIVAEKFEAKSGFSFGAGVGLSTAADSGKTLSTKLFFLLTLPDAFLLQGQAAILKGRLGLDDPKDPPFSLFLAISKDSVQATIGVDYLVPEDTGMVLDAHAKFDLAFFFRDKSAWYVNLGTEKEPVTAEIFRIFKMYSFFMLSARGIRLGGGISYNFEKKIGPFGIKAYAYLKFGAFMNFKPTQVGGYFAIGGGLDVKVLFVRLSFSFTIGLAGEAPKPFIVTGYLDICVRVLRKNRCVKLELTWEKDKEPVKTPVELLIGNGSDGKAMYKPYAINMLTEESFDILSKDIALDQKPTIKVIGSDGTDVLFDDKAIPVIPIDSYINIEFDKPVKAGVALNGLIGGDVPTVSHELVPPQKGKINQVTHNYSVEGIKLYYWDFINQDWKPYSIYHALTPIEAGGLFTTNINNLQIGYWQIDDPTKKNKLSIMARTPINYIRYGTPPPLEDLGITVDKLLCPGKVRTKLCVDFLSYNLNVILKKDEITALPHGVKVILKDRNGRISFIPSVFNKNRSLFVESGGRIELLFPEPTSQVFLKMGAISSNLKVSYYQNPAAATTGGVMVKQEVYNSSQLSTTIEYVNQQQPFDRIVIEPGACLPNTNLSCGTALPSASQLQGVMNTLIQNNALVTGDPLLGQGLTLSKQIPLQYIPELPGHYYSYYYSGYAGTCRLNLNLLRFNTNKRWTFTTDKPQNPLLKTRKVTIIITLKNNVAPRVFTCSFPKFNLPGTLGEKILITSHLSGFLTANAPELTIISKSSVSFDIIGNEFVDNIIFTDNTAFKASFVLNTGATFNYNNIVSFSNLRPDSSSKQEGLNYNFLVTANLNNGGVAELKGWSTCFPIVCCDGNTVQYLQSTCTAVTNQLAVLQTRLVELNQQIQHNEMLCDLLSNTDACVSEGQRYCSEVPRLKEIRTQIQLQITQHIQYQTFYCSGDAVCRGMVPVSPCGAFLFEACFMGWVNFNYNAGIPSFGALQTSTNSMVEAIEKPIQPMWRPDTIISMVVTVQDEVSFSGSIKYPKNIAYVFQTKGPVGHFHPHNPRFKKLELEKKEDEFRLADLKAYVDYSKSYPNADGAIVSAKPLYTLDPKLLLFFVVDYMYTMYGNFAAYDQEPAIENYLNVYILDPATGGSIDISKVKNSFQLNGDPVIPADIQTMIRLLQSQNPCLSIQVKPPKGVHHETELAMLEPLKMYTAVFKSKYKSEEAEVLRYNFQTSRYKTFADHVNSYQLIDKDDVKITKDAVFDIKLASEITLPEFADLDFTHATQIVNNTMAGDHLLIRDFMHPYDRLIDGVFKLQSMPPAVTTEFNIIRDFTTNNISSDYIMGILIRSPEPFNDPKIPINKLMETIKVIQNNGSIDASFDKVIFSKDLRNAFVTRSDMHILNRTIKFRFKQLQYQANVNGKNDYVTVSQVDALIQTPSSLSNLLGADCGRVEAELNQVLQAELVKDATEYQFLIEGANGFSQTYTRSNPDGILPLGEISGIDYNRTYTVRVKNVVGTRTTVYGPSCTVDTKKLFFRIAPFNPAYSYINTPRAISIRLEFTNGSLLDTFNGEVTVQSTGSVTGDGVVTIVNGVGSISIQNSVAEVVTISLTDSGTTGYNVSNSFQLAFVQPATKFIMDTVVPAIQRPSTMVTVKVRATGSMNISDLGYNNSVTLNATGSVVGEGVVTIVKGEGIKNIINYKSEIISLTLADSAATGLDVSSVQTIKFVRAGIVYTITASNTGAISADITVTIRAMFGTTTDTNFNIGVTLIASGADLGGGLVNIVNGVGTAIVKRNTAGAIQLSLNDSAGTGLDVSSTKTITIS